jgi:hypothetical protein
MTHVSTVQHILESNHNTYKHQPHSWHGDLTLRANSLRRMQYESYNPFKKTNQHTELYSLKFITYQQLYRSICYNLEHHNSTNLSQSIRTQTVLLRLCPRHHSLLYIICGIRAPWNVCACRYIIEHTMVDTLCGISVPFASMVYETFTVANGAWQTRVFVGSSI